MKKSRPKRRSKPSLFARVRTYWLFAVVFAAAALWGGRTLVMLPAFHMKALAVAGLSRVSRADVVRRAAIDPLANIWLLDTKAIARRIEALPYVATTYVHRQPPADVRLTITERRPDACVRGLARSVATVDTDLRVLERGCNDARLPAYVVSTRVDEPPADFLHDPELRVLQHDAHALLGLGHRYRSLRHDAYGELEGIREDGVAVRFGDDADLERKQRLIGPILAELGPRATEVSIVDVRAPATPVVEYRAPKHTSPSTAIHKLSTAN